MFFRNKEKESVPSLSPIRPMRTIVVPNNRRYLFDLPQRLTQLTHWLNETTFVNNRVGSEQGRDLALVVYRGEPYINQFLEVRRLVPDLIRHINEANVCAQDGGQPPYASQGFIASLEYQNLFPVEVNGTSLSEIEQMPLPLSNPDIQRINSLFRQKLPAGFLRLLQRLHLSSFSHVGQDLLIRHSLYCFAVQLLARPEGKITIPTPLLPLYRRLTAYGDYFTKLMTDSSLSDYDDSLFFLTLAWGKPWLLQLLGAYIPARLGITPSSATKLYYWRVNNTGVPTFKLGYLKRLAKMMGDVSEKALHPDNLPVDLARYQHYSPSEDRKAAEYLKQYQDKHSLTEGDLKKAHEEAEKLKGRLRLYRKVLQKDIRSSENRSLVLALPDGVVPEMTVTCQNKQSIIVILHFPDRETHLTLEFAADLQKPEELRLFGLPPELAYKNPHLEDWLLGEILPDWLARLKLKHPDIEPIQSSRPHFTIQTTPRDYVQPPVSNGQKESGKKSALPILTPVAQFLAKAPALPVRDGVPPPPNTVFYTEDQIRKEAGNVPEGAVRQMMNTLSEFESGHRQLYKKLEVTGYWTLRCGKDYRVILSDLGDRNFDVVTAGNRKKVYKNLA